MTSEELRGFLEQHNLLHLPPVYRTVTMEEGWSQEVFVTINGLEPFSLLFEHEDEDQGYYTTHAYLTTTRHPLNSFRCFHYLAWIDIWTDDKGDMPCLRGADNLNSFHMKFTDDEQIHLLNSHMLDTSRITDAESYLNRIAWAQAMNDILFVAEHQEHITTATDIYQLLFEREQQRNQSLTQPAETAENLHRQLWHPRQG